MFILLCAAVGNCVAPVVVPYVVVDWVVDYKVCSLCWAADTSAGLLRHKKLLRRNSWHQSLNHLVEKGQTQAFTSILEGREVVLLQEARDKTRGSGPIVSGNEAYCHSLCTLQLVYVLFLPRVPDDGTILQQGSD